MERRSKASQAQSSRVADPVTETIAAVPMDTNNFPSTSQTVQFSSVLSADVPSFSPRLSTSALNSLPPVTSLAPFTNT